MFRLKIFVVLAVIGVACCEVQIPENYRTAKPISAHPRYEEHQLRKDFQKNINNNVGISPFIIGGQPADLGQFPHHALIYIVYPNIGVYLCGGSIIDRNWILTAGHCVYGGAEYFEIFLGVVNRVEGPLSWYGRVYPNDTSLHPEYEDRTLRNDIAMIKIDTPDDLFFDPSVTPIALPIEFVDLVGQNGTVIGFGRQSDNSTSASDFLKFNSLKVITNEECASVFVPGIVQETNLCAETNREASTCGGDSGGAYTFDINGFNRLEGITSFGADIGCQLGYPAGFTRVTSYLNWIYYNINGGTTPPPETDRWEILRKILQKILEFLKGIFGRP